MNEVGSVQNWISDAVQWVGLAIEGGGMVVIVCGILWAAAYFAVELVRRDVYAYKRLRTRLGRAILLGLELLVAADILRTVAFEPSLTQALVLGLIVLIRTFLSFSLEVEISGELPWRQHEAHG